MKKTLTLVVIVVLLLGFREITFAQGTAFTYQGNLQNNGIPANGLYDFRFRLDADSVGNTILATILTNGIPVANGLFTTTLDFGANYFNGSNYWLEIDVRTNNAANYTALNPLQAITPTPYAVFATMASNVSGTVSASQLSGVLPASQLPSYVITNGTSGVNLTGTFNGNGASITNLQISGFGPNSKLSSSQIRFTPPFYYTVGGKPFYVTIADVNGDSKPDLISANQNGSLSVLTNDGGGSFVLSTTPSVGNVDSYVISTDVNKDGKPDLISVDSGTNTLTVMTNNGKGIFSLNATLKVGNQPECVVVVTNINGGGRMALVSANAGASTITVLTNNGSGIFGSNATVNVGDYPWCVVSADINGDGRPDLITANLFDESLTILTNNGNGIFSTNATIPVGGFTYCVTVMDVNNDTKPDLVVADYGDGCVKIFTNNGVGAFAFDITIPINGYPTYVIASDVNGDGKLDLITANAGNGSLTILTNNGNGNFGYGRTIPIGSASGVISVTAGDLNGDNIIDLITANYQQPTISVLLGLTNAIASLDVNGGISSPMWSATELINGNGSLPAQGSFQSNGGTLLISVSGSGYSTSAGNIIGMDIQLDGIKVDSCLIYANSASTHLAFVPKMIKTGAVAGLHTLTLVAHNTTVTDNTDTFNVMIQELPF